MYTNSTILFQVYFVLDYGTTSSKKKPSTTFQLCRKTANLANLFSFQYLHAEDLVEVHTRYCKKAFLFLVYRLSKWEERPILQHI